MLTQRVRGHALVASALALAMLVALALSLGGLRAEAQQGETTIGFFPSTVRVTDALRGQRYEQGTVLLNKSDQARVFSFEAEGPIKDWVQFAVRSKPETLVTEARAEAQGELTMIVYMTVPPGTPNGAYAGLIHYRSVGLQQAQAGADSRSGVVLSLDQPITITVTGAQVLNVNVNDVSTRDVEVGQRLRFRTGLTNGSNVDVTPVLQVNIATSAGVRVAELQQPTEPFKPNESKTVAALEWDTAGQQPGTYVAEYTLTVQGRAFKSGTLSVRLLPFGSLTRSGAIERVTFHGALKPGTIARADIVFRNSGASDVRARFVGELYRKASLVGEAVSQTELLVPVGEAATLNVFFELNGGGKYELRGRVNFEGALSEPITASFDAGGGGILDTLRDVGTGWTLPLLALGALGAVAATIRRRRRRPIAQAPEATSTAELFHYIVGPPPGAPRDDAGQPVAPRGTENGTAPPPGSRPGRRG